MFSGSQREIWRVTRPQIPGLTEDTSVFQDTESTYHQASVLFLRRPSFSKKFLILLSNTTPASSRVTNTSREKNPIFHISPGKKNSPRDDSCCLIWGERCTLESVTAAGLWAARMAWALAEGPELKPKGGVSLIEATLRGVEFWHLKTKAHRACSNSLVHTALYSHRWHLQLLFLSAFGDAKLMFWYPQDFQ